MLLILLLCYFSAVAIPYGFFDDYLVLRQILTGRAKTPWQIRIASGRPVHAVFVQLSYAAMRGPADLRYLRLIAIVFIAILAFLIYRALAGAQWRRYPAICTALLIVTLPPFQVYASWALAASYPLAAITAAAAFYLADCVSKQSGRRKLGAIAGSLLLLWLAVANFQPAMMFFWVFAAIALLSGEATFGSISRRIVLYGLLTSGGLLLGLATFAIGRAKYVYLLPPERVGFTHNLSGKLYWFFDNPLRDALNLVNLWPDGTIAVALAAFILCGMVGYFRGGPADRLFKLLLAVLILLLSYAPNLVTAENWSSYRTQLVLTSLVALYAIMAVQGYATMLTGRGCGRAVAAVLTLLAGAGVLTAAYSVDTYFAIPQNLEQRLIRSQLSQADWAHAREIYAIGCTWRDSAAPFVRYDEFGLPSCSQPWGLIPAVYFVLRETAPAGAALPIEAAPQGGPITPPPGSVVVDMRKLAHFGP